MKVKELKTSTYPFLTKRSKWAYKKSEIENIQNFVNEQKELISFV